MDENSSIDQYYSIDDDDSIEIARMEQHSIIENLSSYDYYGDDQQYYYYDIGNIVNASLLKTPETMEQSSLSFISDQQTPSASSSSVSMISNQNDITFETPLKPVNDDKFTIKESINMKMLMFNNTSKQSTTTTIEQSLNDRCLDDNLINNMNSRNTFNNDNSMSPIIDSGEELSNIANQTSSVQKIDSINFEFLNNSINDHSIDNVDAVDSIDDDDVSVDINNDDSSYGLSQSFTSLNDYLENLSINKKRTMKKKKKF